MLPQEACVGASLLVLQLGSKGFDIQYTGMVTLPFKKGRKGLFCFPVFSGIGLLYILMDEYYGYRSAVSPALEIQIINKSPILL